MKSEVQLGENSRLSLSFVSIASILTTIIGSAFVLGVWMTHKLDGIESGIKAASETADHALDVATRVDSQVQVLKFSYEPRLIRLESDAAFLRISGSKP